MAHRKFGQSKPVEGKEAIVFDIADEEGIACRDQVNGKLLIELVGKVDSGNVARQAEAIVDVFGVCVRSDDGENPDGFTGKLLEKHKSYELKAAADEGIEPGVDPTSSFGRLNAVLDDPETQISVEELAEMVGWLVEQYAARPTVNASTSVVGAKATNRTSRRKRQRTDGTGEEQTLASV